MKKRNSARVVMIIGLALLVIFKLFQMCLFSNSSLNFSLNVSNHSATKPQLQVKKIHDQNNIVVCDRSHKLYDICEINGPTLLDPTKSTFYVTTNPKNPTSVQKIRAYPRKGERYTMSRIKEIKIISGPKPNPSPSPICQTNHNSPGLVFSAGGYTGNFFHEFTDGFIPLFLTVRSLFADERNRNIVLVISKYRSWWAQKYSDILRSFTDFPIVDLDNDNTTHCFPSVKIGLVSHGIMTINPNLTKIPLNLRLSSFRDFIGESFNSYGRTESTRPILVLMNRVDSAKGRVLINEREVKREAEKVGFRVVLFRPSSKTTLSQASELMSSCHVAIGVHGAGLTNAVLFMRPGSTLVQIVPLGVDWLAEVCFGKPAVAVGLDYAEYRIKTHESSLVEKYGREEMVISDPVRFRGKNWSSEAMTIYLKEQNVRLDLNRFRGFLKEAYVKSIKFMDKDRQML